MGGECLLITLKWGRVLQMENWRPEVGVINF